jgi:hypothetical protein
VKTLIDRPEIRVLGLVVDTVDRIMHGMELGAAGIQSQVRHWAQEGYIGHLLQVLQDGGFTTVLLSDHGNVEAEGCGQPTEGASSEVRGERVRICSDRGLRDRLLGEYPGTRAGTCQTLPTGYYPVYPSDGYAFTQKGVQVIAHGGDSLEEVIVPLVTIRSVGATR